MCSLFSVAQLHSGTEVKRKEDQCNVLTRVEVPVERFSPLAATADSERQLKGGRPRRQVSSRALLGSGAESRPPEEVGPPFTHHSASMDSDRPGTIYHWITSSAIRRSERGIVSPSAFAVFMLMTSSKLVGCSTGSSPGFAPLRILSTNTAARRHRPARLAA